MRAAGPVVPRLRWLLSERWLLRESLADYLWQIGFTGDPAGNLPFLRVNTSKSQVKRCEAVKIAVV